MDNVLVINTDILRSCRDESGIRQGEAFDRNRIYKRFSGLHGPISEEDAFNRRLADPGLFTLNELAALAALVQVDPPVITGMAIRQAAEVKSNAAKSKKKGKK